MDNQKLVDEAKKGNEQAFNDLINRHRAKAVNWAKIITKDSYLAEDVAQDVLLRSYLNLETLENSDRFVPWLQRMVKNRAIDYMRKKYREPSYHDSEIDVSDPLSNPEIVTLTREIKASFEELSRNLTERNQKIFKAHFLQQMSPDEIAKQFDTTTANVYNIISRSKLRLREAGFKKEIERYLAARLKQRKYTQKKLNSPNFQSAYTSLGHVLYEIFKKENGLCLSEIMGYSGQAFRIQATCNVDLSSSLIYDWGFVMGRMAQTFGCTIEYLGGPNRLPTPDLLLHSLMLIHDSIDQDNYVIVWNLTICEFGIIHGYNDEKATFTYSNASNKVSEVSYKDLGRTSEVPELFVTALPVDRIIKPSLPKALETIVLHARGKEPLVEGYSQGIGAYDTWINAFENNCADMVGHAYQLALLTEAREQAVLFLQGLLVDESIKINMELVQYLQDALAQYQKVLQIFISLYPSFPFGLPGVQMKIQERTITLLKQAKEHEENGIQIFEEILSKNLLTR